MQSNDCPKQVFCELGWVLPGAILSSKYNYITLFPSNTLAINVTILLKYNCLNLGFLHLDLYGLNKYAHFPICQTIQTGKLPNLLTHQIWRGYLIGFSKRCTGNLVVREILLQLYLNFVRWIFSIVCICN